MATVAYHTLHGTQTVVLDEDFTAPDGTVYIAGTPTRSRSTAATGPTSTAPTRSMPRSDPGLDGRGTRADRRARCRHRDRLDTADGPRPRRPLRRRRVQLILTGLGLVWAVRRPDLGKFRPQPAPGRQPGRAIRGHRGVAGFFDGAPSSDADGTVASYAWNLGTEPRGRERHRATPMPRRILHRQADRHRRRGWSASATVACSHRASPVLNVVWTQVVGATASGNTSQRHRRPTPGTRERSPRSRSCPATATWNLRPPRRTTTGCAGSAVETSTRPIWISTMPCS